MPKKGDKLKHYSLEFKMTAINTYLNGEGGYKSISKQLGIRSHKQLMEWVKKFLEGKSLEDFRGKNPKKGLPNTGRPRTRFNSVEEERDFYKAQVSYLKKRYPNLGVVVNVQGKLDSK